MTVLPLGAASIPTRPNAEKILPVVRENLAKEAHPQKLTLLLDAVSEYAIYMLDTQGVVASWNAGAEKLTGYTPTEIIDQHYSRFFTAEDQQNDLPRSILEAVRTHGRHEAEGWRERKDGSRFFCNAVLHQVRDQRGALVGFAEVTRDITERVKARDAVLASERRFRILVEGVIDYALYMLDPSGIIVNWNTGAERLKGYTADEIVGHHFSMFYSKEDRRTGLPGRVLETANREGRYEAEGWRIRKDGSCFWASVVIDAIRNENGELEGFAKVTRDITERQAAQDTLRRACQRSLRCYAVAFFPSHRPRIHRKELRYKAIRYRIGLSYNGRETGCSLHKVVSCLQSASGAHLI